MNALDVMLGTPPGTHRSQLALPGAIPHAPQIASAGTPAELLRRRPDIIVAERHLAASSARIGVAVSEYYPKFSLSALLGSATAVSGDNQEREAEVRTEKYISGISGSNVSE